MASLKDLRNRINSVKSTRKITSAMKMVAAAKLRRAQEQAERARPYAERMHRMLGALAESMQGQHGAPRLLAGTGRDEVHLIVVCTADRGLCGAFNSNIVREVRRQIEQRREAGKTVKLLCVGRKGRDQLRRQYADLIEDTIEEVGKPRLDYASAVAVAERIAGMFDEEAFDVCALVYARFKSAMTQIVTVQQLVPFATEAEQPGRDEEAREARGEREEEAAGGRRLVYDFEPDEETILEELLPRNMAVQIYRALLENNAGEQGARMTAMDGATRNAEDMIDNLTLLYNRTRQAVITKELNEIVSAKEAM